MSSRRARHGAAFPGFTPSCSSLDLRQSSIVRRRLTIDEDRARARARGTMMTRDEDRGTKTRDEDEDEDVDAYPDGPAYHGQRAEVSRKQSPPRKRTNETLLFVSCMHSPGCGGMCQRHTILGGDEHGGGHRRRRAKHRLIDVDRPGWGSAGKHQPEHGWSGRRRPGRRRPGRGSAGRRRPGRRRPVRSRAERYDVRCLPQADLLRGAQGVRGQPALRLLGRLHRHASERSEQYGDVQRHVRTTPTRAPADQRCLSLPEGLRGVPSGTLAVSRDIVNATFLNMRTLLERQTC